MLADALIVFAGVYLASYFNWVAHNYDWRMDNLDSVYIALFIAFANNFIFGKMRLYSDTRSTKFLATVRDVTVSVILVFAVFSVLLYSLKIAISRLFMLMCAVFIAASCILLRAIAELYLNQQKNASYNCHRILLVGSEERILAVNEALNVQSSWGHKVVGFVPESHGPVRMGADLPSLGSIDDLQNVLISNSIDEAIFAVSPDATNVDLKSCIDLCEKIGTSYRIVPALYDPNDRFKLRVESIQDIPTLVKTICRINQTGMLYKRTLDYVAGSIGFFIFLIIYPFIAIAIKLDSQGPVLFKQRRVGEHGRIFNMYKFRTMVVDAEKVLPQLLDKNEMKGHMFKIAHDPRVTRVGRFLRKTSLDEFPQFINVIRGEMSLVGTRPPTEGEVARYEAWQRRRISMKPGITGLWQVSGRNAVEDFEQVVALDLKYIDNWRFLDDLKILWKTIWVVLARKAC